MTNDRFWLWAKRSVWLLLVVVNVAVIVRTNALMDRAEAEVAKAHAMTRASFRLAEQCATSQLRRVAGSIEAWSLLMPVWPRVGVPEYLRMPEGQ